MESYRKMVGEPYLHASKNCPGKKIKKKELNISTDKKSNWKVKIFCSYIDEK